MTQQQPLRARLVLVGIDASPASLDALAAAALVAARLGAELAGLFVEDEDVLRVAALPFAHVVRSPSGTPARLDPGSAAAALRAVASRARDAIARAAAAQRVPFTFRVARGRVAREVLAAAEGADLLVLGSAGHSRSARAAVGDTARAAVALARTPVLLLARGAGVGEPIVAVDDGGAAGARAWALARGLSRGSRPVIVHAREDPPAAIVGRLARLAPGLAVLPAGVPLSAAALERLLELGIPLLLVR